MRTKLAVAVLAAGLLYVLWPSGDPKPAALDGGDPSLLADRVWLEAMPTSERQHVHIFLALDEPPPGMSAIGVFARASAYQSTTEVFHHRVDGGALELRFPQTGKQASVRFRATECSDHPPFDLCLELSSNPWGGPTRYYGFHDDQAVPAAVRGLAHQLEHAALAQPLARP